MIDHNDARSQAISLCARQTAYFYLETARRRIVRTAKSLSSREGRLLFERKRIARELRDDISQRLAACAIAAGQVELNGETSPGARAGCAEFKIRLSELAEDVHRLSRHLHPPTRPPTWCNSPFAID